MKKLKVIVGALLRGALLLVPGAACAWWAWGKAPALIAVLASVGVEPVFLFVFAFVLFTVKAVADMRAKRDEEPATDNI